MNEKKYEVLIDNKTVAERMDLSTAMILVKALFEEYYKDSLMVSIREMEKCKEVNVECINKVVSEQMMK